MTPLFDPDGRHVAWLHEPHIFAPDMAWLAWLASGHAWSAATGNWLGQVVQGVCRDHWGRVVAWSSPGSLELGPSAPRPPRAPRQLAPRRPLRPPRPLHPGRPLGPRAGWSTLAFQSWCAQ